MANPGDHRSVRRDEKGHSSNHSRAYAMRLRTSPWRRRAGAVAALVLAAAPLVGCVASLDPRVRAAENFRSTVFDLIGKDEAQTKRLNSLRLGMTDQEVLAAAGAPTRRDSRTTDSGRSIETWTYNGELFLVGTLAFESGRLAQISTSGQPPPGGSSSY